MNTIEIKIGSVIYHNGSRYRIIAILDCDHISVRNLSTGTVKKINISEISPDISDSNPDIAADLIPAEDILSIPDEKWTEAHNKALALNQILMLDVDKRRTAINELAKKYGIKEVSLYKQLQKYKNNDGDPLCLLRKKRKDIGSGRFSNEIESYIQEAINEYISNKSPKVINIYHSLQLKIYRHNKGLPDSKKLKIPHINTLRKRIKMLSPQELAKRDGKKGKESLRPILGHFPDVTKPLQIIQIDHTPLDLIIVDDVYREEIGRPTVTLAIDVYSRIVTGFYIALEKPNTLLTGCCLTHAILDKKKWLVQHKVDGEWPVYGLPDTIHTDNGKEFHGKSLKRACELYQINMTKRPAGTPRYGGHIERLFKTFNDAGIHNLPGTTKSNVKDKGEYRAEKEAALTLWEFECWFTEFIVNVYHKKVHTELGMSPLDKFKHGLLGDSNSPGRGLPTRIKDEIRLKIDFLPYEERTVQKYGIQLFGIHYNHDLLRKWIKQPDRTRKSAQLFIIRYDPRDLSSVFFYDPDLKNYIIVPYRDMGRPAVSLWELRALKKIAIEQNPGSPINEDDIFAARDRMQQIVENAKKETKRTRKEKQKELIRQEESIPNQARKKLLEEETEKKPPEITNDDDDFDDIYPYEDIEQ